MAIRSFISLSFGSLVPLGQTLGWALEIRRRVRDNVFCLHEAKTPGKCGCIMEDPTAFPALAPYLKLLKLEFTLSKVSSAKFPDIRQQSQTIKRPCFMLTFTLF